ncbi:MAG: peptide chain release factor N(5)-glutamine methyltransferase [Hyphomicrobiaceae bacterium]
MPAEATLTLGAALAATMARFRAAGLDQPGLDARRLLAACCGLTPGEVLLRPEHGLTLAERHRLANLTERRLAHEPVSRILGVRSFHGLELEISPATLDPRPETETLVDGVLALIEQERVPGGRAPRILDLGTGSGAILLALLHKLPEATGLGTDRSIAALQLAARNAHTLGLQARCTFQQSDWFAAVEGRFDVIVANPPYIPNRDIEHLAIDVRCYDPITALDGGVDGLDPYRVILSECGPHLRPGAWLAVEIGSDQQDAVVALARADQASLWAERGVWQDLSGKPRCVAFRHHA